MASPHQPVSLLRLLYLRDSDSIPQEKTVNRGFTLIELLLAASIGSIIISSILWLIVQLVNHEKQEFSRSQTDQEMHRALEYIASDLRHAVYIYDGSCNLFDSTSCPSYINYVPSNLSYSLSSSTNPDSINIPVLAFWKVNRLSDSQLPSQLSCNIPPTSITVNGTAYPLNSTQQTAYQQDCRTLRQHRTLYSLVIYAQRVDANPNWSGRSRILRYELPKYRDSSILDRTTGFIDPIEVNGLFPTWPLKATNTNCQVSDTTCGLSIFDADNNVFTAAFATTTAVGSSLPVLTDFVDCPDPSHSGTCPGYSASAPTVSDPPCPSGYLPVPRDPNAPIPNSLAALRSRSFFACIVPNPIATGTPLGGTVQDVMVYLRGNAGNRKKSDGSVLATDVRLNRDGYTSLLHTRVTLRGVLDYEPQ